MWELAKTNNKLGMESLSEDLGTSVPCLPHHEGPCTLEIPNPMNPKENSTTRQISYQPPILESTMVSHHNPSCT